MILHIQIYVSTKSSSLMSIRKELYTLSDLKDLFEKYPQVPVRRGDGYRESNICMYPVCKLIMSFRSKRSDKRFKRSDKRFRDLAMECERLSSHGREFACFKWEEGQEFTKEEKQMLIQMGIIWTLYTSDGRKVGGPPKRQPPKTHKQLQRDIERLKQQLTDAGLKPCV